MPVEAGMGTFSSTESKLGTPITCTAQIDGMQELDFYEVAALRLWGHTSYNPRCTFSNLGKGGG